MRNSRKLAEILFIQYKSPAGGDLPTIGLLHLRDTIGGLAGAEDDEVTDMVEYAEATLDCYDSSVVEAYLEEYEDARPYGRGNK